MKPWDLAIELQRIVARACGCTAAWDEEHEMTSHELSVVEREAVRLLRSKVIEAVDREIDARRRLKERGL